MRGAARKGGPYRDSDGQAKRRPLRRLPPSPKRRPTAEGTARNPAEAQPAQTWGAGRGLRRRKPGKWQHVWENIREENAVTGCAKDQKIANIHNKVCAKRIIVGTCERINAKKVAQIRYEYTHRDRHRKQNYKKPS